jgi:hypothetical protein
MGIGGPSADYTFGSTPSMTGTGAGQLAYPSSIVRQGTNLFISGRDNRRISVFTTGGAYIASFGYGVLDGADTFEACGVGIGNCQAGVAYGTDNRSYFSRLDFGRNGTCTPTSRWPTRSRSSPSAAAYAGPNASMIFRWYSSICSGGMK